MTIQTIAMGRPAELPDDFPIRVCHAPGCKRSVEPQFQACAVHWGCLPVRLQRLAWATGGGPRPSSAHMMVVKRCISFWVEYDRNA